MESVQACRICVRKKRLEPWFSNASSHANEAVYMECRQRHITLLNIHPSPCCRSDVSATDGMPIRWGRRPSEMLFGDASWSSLAFRRSLCICTDS